MDPRKLILTMAIGACLVGAGCQSLEQSAPPVSGVHANVSALENGRRLFVTRCANCHGVVAVADHGYEEWEEIVADMAERSKLTAAGHADILAYLRVTVPR